MGAGISGLYKNTRGAINALIARNREAADFFEHDINAETSQFQGQITILEYLYGENLSDYETTIDEIIREFFLELGFLEKDFMLFERGDLWIKLRLNKESEAFFLESYSTDSLEKRKWCFPVSSQNDVLIREIKNIILQCTK